VKRLICAYDANLPGGRYQELLRQLVILGEGNEKILAELKATRQDLRELKELAAGMSEKVNGLHGER
jgi:hypothetical protein